MQDVLTYQIINALQIHPRVSWARLGRILNVDSSTISRRWQRLIRQGLVWTTCFEARDPRGSNSSEVTALVEVRCRPGQRSAVIDELAARPQVASINCTSGSRDFFVMMGASTLAGVDALIDDHIASAEGVTSIETHYLRTVFFESSYWRLQYLSPDQISALERLRPESVSGPPRPEHREVVDALRVDARRSAAEIAAELDRPLGWVSRAIDYLLASEWMRWRTDFAQSVMDWAASAVIWLDVAGPMVTKVATAFRMIPNTRMCATVTGDANLVLTLWLHSVAELDEIERGITAAFPSVRITDRWLVSRTAKRAGVILDHEGRRMQDRPAG